MVETVVVFDLFVVSLNLKHIMEAIFEKFNPFLD
jgi:hypothetical protein